MFGEDVALGGKDTQARNSMCQPHLDNVSLYGGDTLEK